ncbi:glycosyltransferase family 2 protein [Pseudohalioglobus lutimaris]|uniref:Glycosyl transferase family 2 n=1 Tax=Pseudohalioglobus lutimaris TaxID=1737061 RepID=A0A2N5WXU3_9GAMM|nr:glycosyltransferase family 2 protein [Pseudohalioglobus lutimaris]PLW67044.1 glycosyl transferase family 2 [Pseudohalioglobus lutimaris]
MAELSVIVVNWNTSELLKNCLESIYSNLDKKLRIEIVVVDNASSDDSVAMVKACFPRVKLIENNQNVGFARANNQAVGVATGKYLLLLNSDTIVLDDGALEVLGFMEENPEVGIVTAKLQYEDGEFQPPYRRFPGFWGTFWRNTFRRIRSTNSAGQKRFLYSDLDPESVHEVDWGTGAYLYVSRSLVTGGKIFNEDIFMYYEDTILCKRAGEEGFRVMYLPFAPVIHLRDRSASKVKLHSLKYSFQGSIIYIRHIYGPVVSAVYRYAVRVVWRMLYLACRLVPSSRFSTKAQLFRYMINECTFK